MRTTREALSSLLQEISGWLSPAAPSAGSGDDDRPRLTRLFRRIQATLRDAEQAWRPTRSESTALWLKELKHLAGDIEDVLDDFEYEDIHSKKILLQEGGDCDTELQGSLLDGLTGRIADIRERFEEITKDRDALNYMSWISLDDAASPDPLELVRETSSFPMAPQLFGRDRVREEMVEFLVGGRPVEEGPLSVLAIVGIGGLGKTTLAQFVFNDHRIVDYFHHKIWVHVSSEFDVKKVTRQIVEHVADPGLMSLHHMDNLNMLQMTVAKTLRGTRFLLVLDDMWYEDCVFDWLRVWESLCAPLICGGNGSKILVTTRSAQVVARITQPVKTIELEGLEFEDACSLFKKHAFLGGNSGGHQKNLESIGRRIVGEKLKGVPLAVVTVASLLCSESEESEWTRVLESEMWVLEQGQGGILPALRLSYQHLPWHLKPCFAYLCVFPKGCEFTELELVQLWMALGYIQSDGKNRVEDVGSYYLKCLMNRSLVQCANGKYLVHDLLHDVGRLVLQDEFCTIESDKLDESSAEEEPRQLHLSLLLRKMFDSGELEKLQNFKKLRTFSIFFCGMPTLQVPGNLFMRWTGLRVLDLGGGSGIHSLPDSIGNLRHLRYLDLRRTGIRCLPESLCRLYMLQTLNLQGCDQLGTLPKGMSNLVNLRHLEVRHELVSRISGFGKLAHLQEIQVLSISEGDGIKIEDLQDMDELRGRLCIQNLQRVGSKEAATLANLSNKKYVNNLQLEWVDDQDVNQINSEVQAAVLEALSPPPKLKELTIKYHAGDTFPTWMQSENSVSALESITLHQCQRWEALPPRLGGLPSLKTIDIACFPMLNELPNVLPTTLTNLRLQEVLLLNDVKGLKELPLLQELVLCNIPHLGELPPLPTTLRILTLENLGLDALPEYHRVHGESTGGKSGICNSLFLHELRIASCERLILLGGVLRHHLPHLILLSINDCKELLSWPEGQGFQATLSSLQGELSIVNCPKLMALPEGSVISPSLKKLTIMGSPGLPDGSLFAQLHNLKNLTRSGDVYVQKPYPDMKRLFEEALMQQMGTVEWLTIRPLELDNEYLRSGPPVISFAYGIYSLMGRDRRCVALDILRKGINPVLYGVAISTLFTLLRRHQRLFSSLFALEIYSMPHDVIPFIRSGEEEEALCTWTLPSLEALAFADCTDMERLPMETLLRHLKQLKNLSIVSCPELTLASVEEALRSLPSLEGLFITGCPKLLPLLPVVVGATDVAASCTVRSADDMGGISLIPPSTTTTTTTTTRSDAVDKGPSSSHPSSPSSSCTSSLSSSSSSSTRRPPPLRRLVTDDVGLLADPKFAGNHLTSLHKLVIGNSDMKSLTLLPSPMGNEAWPRSLRFLEFNGCPNLRELPPELGSLAPSLQVLSMFECPALLQPWVPKAGLPLSLEVLQIYKCPGLEVEDWRRVTHVRLVTIDCIIVQGSYRDYEESSVKRDFWSN